MKNKLPDQMVLLLIMTLAFGCQNSTTGNQINDFRPSILKQLDGEWIANGNVMGDDVEYILNVRPILNFTFSELHMTDAANPPQYEALVFIGYDTTSKKIISHWLDSFGPAFSIPHGIGFIDNNTIEFTIPYEEGPFRDRLTFNDRDKSWSLIIESSSDSISWNKFAEYIITKKGSGY